MKKSLLKTLGVVCLVGGASAATCYYVKKRKETGNKDDDQLLLQSNAEEIENLESDKAVICGDIKERHEKAASEMKESLQSIMDETPVTETENTETLNSMMKDIDKLME